MMQVDAAVLRQYALPVELERGLLALRAGPHHNVIRTLMPLNIPEELLHQGLNILERELARVSDASG